MVIREQVHKFSKRELAMKDQLRLKQGKELARQLFDLKLTELELMHDDQKKEWMRKFNLLSIREFEDVRSQVIKAKTSQQSQIGWQVLPHDLSVLVFCLVSIFFSLKSGLIAGIFVLIMLESIFQVFFNQTLYKILGYAVWLTYPAYIFLGYVLYQRGFIWWQIIGIIALAWAGSFAMGAIAAIPMQLYLKERARSRQMEKKKPHA